jgi:hypothetical protein
MARASAVFVSIGKIDRPGRHAERAECRVRDQGTSLVMRGRGDNAMHTIPSPPHCPHCGSPYVPQTRPQELKGFLLRLVYRAPLQCQICLHRFHAVGSHLESGSLPVEGLELARSSPLSRRLAIGGMMLVLFMMLGGAWVLLIGIRPCALSYLLWR